MTRTLRFILVLLVGLAALTWAAASSVQKTNRQWADEDIVLRVRLVAREAGPTLLQYWSKQASADLANALSNIARDERIMAAAACSSEGALLAQSTDFPKSLTCRQIADLVHSEIARQGAARSDTWPWGMVWPLLGGDVQVSAVPMVRATETLGLLVLVHDLTFIERREAKMREFLVFAFGILGLAASLVTVIAARLSWRGLCKWRRPAVH